MSGGGGRWVPTGTWVAAGDWLVPGQIRMLLTVCCAVTSPETLPWAAPFDPSHSLRERLDPTKTVGGSASSNKDCVLINLNPEWDRS